MSDPVPANRPSALARAADAGLSLILAAITLIVILLILEAGVRVFVSNAQLNAPIYAAQPQDPGYGLVDGWQGKLYVAGHSVPTTIDAGHRLTPGAPGEKGLAAGHTVHFVGDSQAFGLGLPDDATIAARVQARLGPGYRVINHGVPGWGPVAYQNLLQGLPLEDIVLVLHTADNDLHDAEDAAARSDVGCNRLRRGAAVSTTACFLADLRLVQLMASALRGVVMPKRSTPLQYDRAVQDRVPRLVAHVAALYDAARARRGNKLMFSYVPWRGLYIPEWAAARYAPPAIFPNTQGPAFPDDCDISARFTNGTARDLFLNDNPHVSAAGADLLAACFVTLMRQRGL